MAVRYFFDLCTVENVFIEVAFGEDKHFLRVMYTKRH